jgi:hypothetical protein
MEILRISGSVSDIILCVHEYQINEFSAVCTGILEIVVLSPNQNLSECYNTMSVLRSTYWKCLNTVQLLASKQYPIKFVQAKCKCGKPVMTFACIPLSHKLLRLYSHLTYCTCRVLPLALGKLAAPREHFIHH